MKKVLVFGASNSKNAINKTFAIYAANQLKNIEVLIADLNDYAAPLYAIDLEKKHGIDEHILRFYDLIQQSDAIVLSLAEYNNKYRAQQSLRAYWSLMFQ